jgi:hypothetical protein
MASILVMGNNLISVRRVLREKPLQHQASKTSYGMKGLRLRCCGAMGYEFDVAGRVIVI